MTRIHASAVATAAQMKAYNEAVAIIGRKSTDGKKIGTTVLTVQWKGRTAAFAKKMLAKLAHIGRVSIKEYAPWPIFPNNKEWMIELEIA